MTTPSRDVRRRSGRTLLLALVLTTAVTMTSTAATAGRPPHGAPDFGPNVTVFDPSMPVAEIQATLDAAHAAQVDNEMGTERYAYLFKPGTYGTAEQPLQIKVGYYTEISGLGASPTDVVINGKVEVYNRCLADGGTGNCLALVNFWRTLSNLSINVNAAGQDGCRSSANFWAVSQAVSHAPAQHQRRQPVADGLLHRRPAVRQRRLHRRLQAAGRHQRLAAAVADPQQRGRRLVQRACGTRSSPASSAHRTTPAFPDPPYTTLDDHPAQPGEAVPVRRRARAGTRSGCPPPQRNTSGISWADGMTPGRTIPLGDFFVAKPSRLGAASSTPARAGQAPAAHPRRVRHRAQHRGPAARTRWSSASGTPR